MDPSETKSGDVRYIESGALVDVLAQIETAIAAREQQIRSESVSDVA